MNRLILFLALFLFYWETAAQTELKVVEVTQSECDRNADIRRIQPRIIKKTFTNDTLSLTIGTVANCSGIDDVKASLKDDTLCIDYTNGRRKVNTIEQGEKIIIQIAGPAFCDCCFEFCFEITGIDYEPCAVKINGSEYIIYPDKYKLYPVKYDIIDGDTINYIDKYGRKQGKWNNNYESKRYRNHRNDIPVFDAYYVDDKPLEYRKEQYYNSGKLKRLEIYNNSTSSSCEFYEIGTIKEMSIYSKGYCEHVKFYENGQIKAVDGNLVGGKMYYPNGVLKYERLLKNKDNIFAKYYYDDGKLMSIYFIKYDKENILYIKKRWQKFYDKNGKKVTKEYMIKQGYKDLLNL